MKLRNTFPKHFLGLIKLTETLAGLGWAIPRSGKVQVVSAHYNLQNTRHSRYFYV